MISSEYHTDKIFYWKIYTRVTIKTSLLVDNWFPSKLKNYIHHYGTKSFLVPLKI